MKKISIYAPMAVIDFHANKYMIDQFKNFIPKTPTVSLSGDYDVMAGPKPYPTNAVHLCDCRGPSKCTRGHTGENGCRSTRLRSQG